MQNMMCLYRRGQEGSLSGKKKCLRIGVLFSSALVIIIQNLDGGTHDEAIHTKMLC